MNVLLTHAYFLEEDAREQAVMRPYVPLGILYLSAYLEQHHVPHEVYDTTFSNKSHFHQDLLNKKPAIIGFYVNLMTRPNVLETIRFIKTMLPGTTIILGGPEVRFHAENFLRHGAHYIVMGEGEETLLALIEHLNKPGSVPPLTISGLAFMIDQKMVQTPERAVLKRLDTLPIPNRKKINLQQYLDTWRKHHGQNAISISTMRGCPYTCKWCSRAVYGLSYRRRPAHAVAEEMAWLKKHYQPDTLWFVDDVFTISYKWLSAFKEALATRQLQMPYECITRADRMNETIIQILKETGCFRVWIGAESGSQNVINLMDRRVDITRVQDMIRLANQHGIETGTFIMLGYPGETETDIQKTVHHLKAANPNHFTITLAYPIRGTDLYEETASQQIHPQPWHMMTDRDIDFKRTYPKQYYNFALRYVTNEVNYHKHKSNPINLQAASFKIKSIAAKMGMWWTRTTNL